MQLLSELCLLLYVAITTVVGSRLLWVGWRMRRRPELLLGAGAVLIGTVGAPLSVASGFGRAVGEVHVPLWVGSELVTQIGIVCCYAFTQQVFRPGVSWARALIALVVVCLPGGLAGAAHGLASASPGTASVVATGGWLVFCQLAYAGAFAWSTIEGTSHYRAARRRVAIGLLEPAVANRFLLFAIYGLGGVGIALANVAGVLLGLDIASSLLVLVPSAVLALVSAVAMLLAVLPPAWYLARLESA